MLGDKPLIAYSLVAAINSGKINEVYVSTESNEIGSIAISYGARWIKRPVELAGDKACLTDAYMHAFDYLLKHKLPINKIVFMMPTYPFKTAKDVADMIDLLEEYGCVTWYNKILVDPFSYYIMNRSGYYRGIKLSSKMNIDNSETQELYLLNHSISTYKGIPKAYKQKLNINIKEKEIVGLNILVDRIRGIDINLESDFNVAKKIIKKNYFNFNQSFLGSRFCSFQNK